GGGVAAYVANRTVSHTVPNLVGVPVDELRRVAAENDWLLPDEADKGRDDNVPAGHVMATEPAAGEKLAEGQVLRYTESLGNTLAPVPALAGEHIDDARTLLDDAELGLAELFATEHSETVA